MKKLHTDQAGAGQPVSCLGLVIPTLVHCLFVVQFLRFIGMLCRQYFPEEAYTLADAMQANHVMGCAERPSQAATVSFTQSGGDRPQQHLIANGTIAQSNLKSKSDKKRAETHSLSCTWEAADKGHRLSGTMHPSPLQLRSQQLNTELCWSCGPHLGQHFFWKVLTNIYFWFYKKIIL